MLYGKLSLHDIRDVEAFCAHIIHNAKHSLTQDEHEQLLTYLIEEAWLLSERYNPGDRPSCFSNHAGRILRGRVVDWWRGYRGRTTWQTKGRTYHARPRPHLEPIHQLEHLDAGISADPVPDGHPALLRLLRDRARTPLQPPDRHSEETTSHAA